MSKLTKADVARHLQISRQTLYEWIGKGRISVGADGFIDSAEVARVSGSVTQLHVSSERHHGHIVTSPMADTIRDRELIEVLKAQLEEERASKRFLQEQVDRLTSILDRRLLEAPKSSTPEDPSGPVLPRRPPPRRPAPSPFPRTWQEILVVMQCSQSPKSALQIENELDLRTSARFVLRRMVDAGLLRREQKGLFALTEYGQSINPFPTRTEERRRQAIEEQRRWLIAEGHIEEARTLEDR